MKFSNVRKHSKKSGKTERQRDKEIYNLSHMLYRYRLNDLQKKIIIEQLKELV